MSQNAGPQEATPAWVKAVGAILAVPVLALLLPSLLVLTVCLLPTFGAYVADRYRDKALAVTVGTLNFCGALPALGELWAKGQTMAATGEVLADAFLWLLAYGAAATGWLIFMSMPPLVSAYMSFSGGARVEQMRRRQEALIEVWGQEVADRSAATFGEDEAAEPAKDPKPRR